MRAGLSTIQQTLTPEAANVLNHSIGEAGRRNHGQTTPLHVAATLLASPSGFLRQACIKSHPNSSHPLQCRALELCFSVALERLPTAQNVSSGIDPPLSNALWAALKRAQAHQRRGCPEQQQQPLLAVKVELEQLIISILDDPSVSRVMREASFSSPAVKATIEQSLNSSASVGNSSPMGLGFRAGATPVPPTANRNLYLNPRLQQQGSAAQLGQQRGEEVKRVIDILLRTKKRNPVLVGESEPEAVVRELLRRIENKELGEGPLGNARVIRLEKEFSSDRAQIPAKVKELGDLIATSSGSDVILDLGDLKWLVEQPVSFGVPGSGTAAQQQVVSEVGRAAVAEMGKLLGRFGEGSGGRLWLIGTATCETYLRCQVYHPSMENDWDLQAVPIPARAPSGMFPRILSSSVESLSPLKGFPAATTAPPRRLSENLDPGRRSSCCPQCIQKYEQELATLLPKDLEKSSSEVKSEATRQLLPPWLQNAKGHDSDAKAMDQTKTKDQELVWKQRSQELLKKWNDTCLRLHPNFHQPNLNSERITPVPLSMTGLYNPNLIGRQSFQPKLQLNRNLGETLQSNANQVPTQPSEKAVSLPGSPVRTELVLGRTKVCETSPDQTHKELIKDFLGRMSSEPQNNLHEIQSNKLFSTLDADSFKKLLKGLMEKVWWQRDAASAVATTVTHCRVGNGKRRGAASKGDMWLLFVGCDRAGKKKMASALSELVSGSNPITICLGSQRDDGESGMSFRGKTALDRITEAVKRYPFSVIMLEDIDQADAIVRGSIKRAMERGRIADSHGRETSLGSVIFILTANWLPENLKCLSDGVSLDEEKLARLAKGGWQLRLSLCERTAKRRANWLHDKVRPAKPSRKETSSGLAFDLNEAADVEDDRTDGSHNSSDLTIDHECEHGLNTNLRSPTTSSSVPRELLDAVDETIVFKPVSFGPISSKITTSINKKFSTIMGDGISIEVQEEALENITSGVWFGQTGLEEWLEKVLAPSFHQLKSCLSSTVDRDDSMVIRLEHNGNSDSRSSRDFLPSSVKVVADGL
ncbi:protein SUPPRESSOR OF MAX2 1 isoform X2 [Corylus avellana]|uniref:protein SUPPRESSOR OF MAX2 1 isoform X2 n=1 Tax=Corylus avellana TaxID=13451 RepID=UPI00286B7A13|nr:protein SUPPRESSOR OF MAX2 1 isoform X2 [Corylus avellana]